MDDGRISSAADQEIRREVASEEAGMKLNYKHRKLEGRRMGLIALLVIAQCGVRLALTYTSLRGMSCHVMSCHVMSCYVLLSDSARADH
jgi:hypothetical protein